MKKKPPGFLRSAVPQKMLERAMQGFEERLRMCVRQEGRHLTDIIFHT